MRDWDISESLARKIIQQLNRQIRGQFPEAIVVKGKVSRGYYERCCCPGDNFGHVRLDGERMYVGPKEVAKDWGVSVPAAYGIIHRLNGHIREQYPEAVTVSGKVCRAYYRRCSFAKQEQREAQ